MKKAILRRMAIEKWVIPTKFNKTGKRVLTIPLDYDKVVYAPANRRYKQDYYAIEAEFKRNKDKPLKGYIEKMSDFLASYVASDSASKEDRYRITKFLAECRLKQSERWSEQLGNISGLSEVDQEAWQAYMEADKRLWEEREEALYEARSRRDAMKKELRREIAEAIHHECHPEGDKQNK